jgi:hypothetical protein
MFKGCTDVVVVIKENVSRLKIRDPTFRLPLVKARNTGGGNSQLVVLLRKNIGIKTCG